MPHGGAHRKIRHDTDEFLQVIQRMGGYVNQSFPLHPQRRLAERMREEHGNFAKRRGKSRLNFWPPSIGPPAPIR